MLRRKLSLLLFVPTIVCGCANKEFDYAKFYKERCEYFTSLIETDKHCDIDFVGDSITERYELDKYYSEYKTANRGISGDTTDMLLTRMEISSILLEPKLISLLIGTNNLDTCMKNYEYILKGFKDNLPETKVVVVSILPRRGDKNMKKIVENNSQISLLAASYNYTYVDLYSEFLKDGKVNESLFKDGLHPNASGYQLMTDLLKPVFVELLNE